MLTILNTSILTAFGQYNYQPVSIEEARRMVSDGFVSAVGHESTAAIISSLLGVDCPANRVVYQQRAGERALVFKLNGRPPEGVILTPEEIEGIGYGWAVLTRTA